MSEEKSQVKQSEIEANDQQESEPGAETFTIDERFEILKNNRRRVVLQYLQEADGTVKLSNLADHVTAVENETDVNSITSSERKRVYVGLYQFHLPKMSKMGVIDYDQDRGDISLTERGANLYQKHENRSEKRRPWHLAYLAVVGIGVLGILITLLAQQWIVAVGLMATQTFVLGTIALAHLYVEHDT